ncbi:unnamed protein product [Agarophyton chilense]|eukprot:gb/GEZJ01003539.1/.p1 GENE.gb/GEZJ01003539.1/~~gb/GEZJ01003539.1/.p1  ORF type:complete len:360 (+),score=26.72 gb/GEZJ01003539.1/:3514-4593(+)
MAFQQFSEEKIGLPPGLIIALRPLTTLLISSVISAISELFLVSGVNVLIVFAENRALLRGNAVSIERHMLRIRVAAILPIFMFLLLETLISSYQISAFLPIPKRQPCVEVGQSAGLPRFLNNEELFNQSIVVQTCETLEITKTGNVVVSVFGGSLNLQPGPADFPVNCDKDWIFNYSYKARPLLKKHLEKEPFCFEDYDTCSYAISIENVVSVGIFLKNNGSRREERKTVLNFRPDSSLTDIAKRRLELHREGIADDKIIRQLLFLTMEKAECEMSLEQSLLPYWIVGLAGCMWTLSFFLFALTLMLKRAAFYNISNAKDWVKKIDWSKYESIQGNDTHVRSMKVDGVRKFYLCGACQS